MESRACLEQATHVSTRPHATRYNEHLVLIALLAADLLSSDRSSVDRKVR